MLQERAPGRASAGASLRAEPTNGWRRAHDTLERMPTLVGLLALIAVQVALHAPWLRLPPAGFHLWRQTQTLSVARNFYDEGFDPLRPRVDFRGTDTGVTGMEFPLVNAAIAAGYGVLGFHHALHRVVMLVLSLPAILGMMLLARAWCGSRAAGFVAGALLVTNPLFLYYSVSALPEVPMLGAMLLGLVALTAWSRSACTRALLGGLAGLTLAGLMKLSSGVVWPAAMLLLRDGLRRASGRQRVMAIAASTAALGVLAAWYLWARHLTAVSGNESFLLAPIFPYPLARVLPMVRGFVFRWIPEVYVSYPQFALVLVGLPLLVRAPRPRAARLLGAWGLGTMAYGILMLPHLRVHDYYMAPATPALLLVATLGLERLWRAAYARRAAAWIAALLLALTATIGPWRGLSRLARAKVSPDLVALETTLADLRVPPDALVVTADDPSPSINLYFMHRKGWVATKRLTREGLEGMIHHGARYLVSDSRPLEARPELAPHLRLLGGTGRFRVFALV